MKIDIRPSIKKLFQDLLLFFQAQLSLELTYHPPDGNGSLPYDERPYPPDDEDEGKSSTYTLLLF